MKTLALTTTVFVASAATMLAQGQPEIEALSTRADAHERRISLLEKEISRLRAAQPKQQKQQAAPSTTRKQQAMAASYTVVKGDTLTRIARRNKTTVSALKKANGLRSDSLQIGQKLSLPGSQPATRAIVVDEPAKTPAVAQKKPAAPTSRAVSKGSHVVKTGETFYAISRRHNVSVNSLKAANPKVNPNRLQVGQKLVIDGSAKMADVKRPASSEARPLSKEIAQAPKKSPSKKASTSRSVKMSKAPAERVENPSNKPREVERKQVAKKEEQSIRTITVHQQMTYGQFASRYSTTTAQLNALNGLSLSKNTMLAKGSELYVTE